VTAFGWQGLFTPAPQQWGLRGDPIVGDLLAEHLSGLPAPVSLEPESSPWPPRSRQSPASISPLPMSPTSPIPRTVPIGNAAA